MASPGGLEVEVWSRGMPCKVIPFPAAGKANATPEPVMIRRRMIVNVGGRRYDVDLIGLVRPMSGALGPSPPTQRGLSAASRAEKVCLVHPGREPVPVVGASCRFQGKRSGNTRQELNGVRLAVGDAEAKISCFSVAAE